jgi:hypothetical protein
MGRDNIVGTHCCPTTTSDRMNATINSDRISATVTQDTFVAFDTAVAFVIPLVILLMSATVM